VGIFPLKLFFGLTGNRPQSAPACSFLRYAQAVKGSTTQQYNCELKFNQPSSITFFD
jgi:hypothetical protein